MIHDLNNLLPSAVLVSFPQVIAGLPDPAPYTINVTLVSLVIPELAGVSGHTGTHLLYSTDLASLSAVGATPDNNAELLALAKQMALDWYRWQLGRCSLKFDGIVPWVPEGFHDLEFLVREGEVSTRVERLPWEPGVFYTWGSYGTGSPSFVPIAWPLIVTVTTSTTGSAVVVSDFTVNTTGTPTVGFGVTSLWSLSTTTAVNVPASFVTTTWTTPTGGSQISLLTFGVYTGTTPVTGLTITTTAGGTPQVTVPGQFTTNTHTVTPGTTQTGVLVKPTGNPTVDVFLVEKSDATKVIQVDKDFNVNLFTSLTVTPGTTQVGLKVIPSGTPTVDVFVVEKSDTTKIVQVDKDFNVNLLTAVTVTPGTTQVGLTVTPLGAPSVDVFVVTKSDLTKVFQITSSFVVNVNTTIVETVTTTATNTAVTVFTSSLNTTNTPVTDFGQKWLFELSTTTTANTKATFFTVTWDDPTDGSQVGKFSYWTYNNTTPVLNLEVTNIGTTNPIETFYGTTKIVATVANSTTIFAVQTSTATDVFTVTTDSSGNPFLNVLHNATLYFGTESTLANPTPGILQLPTYTTTGTPTATVPTGCMVWDSVDKKLYVSNGGGVYTDVTSGGPPSGTAGGDLSGTYPNPTVANVNGFPVTGSPSDGKLLIGTTTGPAWQAQAMSGDAGIDNGGVLTLANTAVTPATYTNANITVDSKGRITAASNGSAGGSPAGSNSDIQFNESGAFAACTTPGDFGYLEISSVPTLNVGVASGKGKIAVGGSYSVEAPVGGLTLISDSGFAQDYITFSGGRGLLVQDEAGNVFLNMDATAGAGVGKIIIGRSGISMAFFNGTPTTQPGTTAGHGATAGGTYGANEQKMLQDAFSALEALSLMA